MDRWAFQLGALSVVLKLNPSLTYYGFSAPGTNARSGRLWYMADRAKLFEAPWHFDEARKWFARWKEARPFRTGRARSTSCTGSPTRTIQPDQVAVLSSPPLSLKGSGSGGRATVACSSISRQQPSVVHDDAPREAAGEPLLSTWGRAFAVLSCLPGEPCGMFLLVTLVRAAMPVHPMDELRRLARECAV